MSQGKPQNPRPVPPSQPGRPSRDLRLGVPGDLDSKEVRFQVVAPPARALSRRAAASRQAAKLQPKRLWLDSYFRCSVRIRVHSCGRGSSRWSSIPTERPVNAWLRPKTSCAADTPLHCRYRLVGVAQLVELRVVVSAVAGSNPVAHPL
jgi:hypothetical protein